MFQVKHVPQGQGLVHVLSISIRLIVALTFLAPPYFLPSPSIQANAPGENKDSRSPFIPLKRLQIPIFNKFIDIEPSLALLRHHRLTIWDEMEVDKYSFYALLLDILTDISEARFVAIDLELSGVCSKTPRAVNGRQTLQERYLETKEAAERYQILQFGLTCVHQDVENQQYVLKPYNFEICPIVQERGLSNDIERVFSYQSGAVEFLLKVGFDMAKPFTHGVPYLSRSEARDAREKYDKRQDRTTMSDIHIKPTDVESLAFMKRVRREVDGFLRANNADHYNIDSAKPSQDAGQPQEELSRFEKRLVHQLIRAEYPDLVTISKRGFIQVVKFDKEREDRIAADRKHELEERLNRQKGFRWVIDALLGSSSISNLDVKECARNPVTGEPIFADLTQYRAQFHRACTRIRGNPKMVVGHNCFLDMVYIYRTFIGPLPDTVEEFSKLLHAHWPEVVDTKYMSTHTCGDINPVSSLEQIANQLSFEKTPKIVVDGEHKKYDEIEAFHEAGYDSFLTAQIAVTLSSKLTRAGAHTTGVRTATNSAIRYSPQKSNSVKDQLSTALSAIKLAPSSIAKAISPNSSNGEAPEDASIICEARTASNGEGFVPSDPNFQWKSQLDPSLGPLSGEDAAAFRPENRVHHYKLDHDAAGSVEGGMPRMDSYFWKVYGNKLRVFGTEESVCALTKDDPSGTSGDEDGEGGVAVK
nr:poly(a)-specific ribonuclease parn [Quercus suber]